MNVKTVVHWLQISSTMGAARSVLVFMHFGTNSKTQLPLCYLVLYTAGAFCFKALPCVDKSLSDASCLAARRLGSLSIFSVCIPLFWKLGITSNTSREDTRERVSHREGGEQGGSGETGKRRRHRHNVEHLCKVIAAAQPSVLRVGQERKHSRTSL